jgi:hypothetical protein
MTLNPNQFHMHMYHGTSKDNAEYVKAQGLGPNSYVTTDRELAEYYAGNYKEPRILKLRVNPRKLLVDWNSFEEPVHTDTPREFDESKLDSKKAGGDWKNSLRQTGSAQYWGTIPKENIIEIQHP